MRKTKAYFLSLLGALTVVLPIYLAAAAILFTRTRPVDTLQSGVPVVQPRATDARTLLLMTGPEQPETFVLLRFDAWSGEVCTAALPAEAVMLVGGQPVTLAEAAQQAGPAQSAAAIEETLGITVDNYFYCTADDLLKLTDGFGTARIPLANYLTPQALAQVKLDLPGIETLSLTPAMLAQVLAADAAAPDLQTLLRAEGYLAFLRVGGAPLAEKLPDALRAALAGSATDLTAVQIYDYERIFNFLQKDPPEYRAGVFPGAWAGDRYELSPDAPAVAAGYFTRPSETPEPASTAPPAA